MKPKLFTQEKMPESMLPKAKEIQKEYGSLQEFFDDPEAPNDQKLRWFGHIVRFETLNGITKKDLQAIIRWLFSRHYRWEEVENPPPDLRVIKNQNETE